MPSTPRVEALSWGRVVTSDGVFKDARLWPGTSREWDWRDTGTQHDPGVQAADLDGMLGDVATVVIGCGQHQRLGVTDGARQAVTEAGADLEVLASPAAVERHNHLVAAGLPVATLIHSTC